MEGLRFEENEPVHWLRMTEDEAKAVIDLWAERHREEERLRTQPSVQDVAAGLDIPPEEAFALLQQMRAGHVIAMQAQAETVAFQKTTRSVVPLAIAVGVLALIALLLLPLFFFARHVQSPSPPTPISVENTTPAFPSVEAPTPPPAGSSTPR